MKLFANKLKGKSSLYFNGFDFRHVRIISIPMVYRGIIHVQEFACGRIYPEVAMR